jgi:MFS family permease
MTMVAPGLPTISRELEVTDAAETPIILSVFLLAYAFGPLIFGPLSEEFGRVIVLQLSNIWFLIFNTVCGFSNTKSQLIAARFLSGFGGSATMGVRLKFLSVFFC